MRQWLLHLGSIASESGWNSLNVGASGLSNLVDSTGAATTVGVSVAPAIAAANGSGTGSSSRYPADVSNTSVYTASDGFLGAPTLYTLTLSGLDPAKLYDVVLYASRSGVGDVRTARYTIGAASVVLDAANNVNSVATLSDIAPNSSGNIVLTWQGDTATNTNGSRLGYLGVVDVTEKGSVALTAGTASFVSADALGVTLACVAASGGSGSYSYQWHRSTTAGFTPDSGTVLAGATSLAPVDTTAVAGVLYFYKLAVSDGSTTVFSNQVMGALNVPTTPLAVAYHPTLVLGYIGSSTWILDAGAGTIPALIRTDLLAINPSAVITTVNGAVSGSVSADFVPGQSDYESFKATMQATGGSGAFKILRLMIGSNDVQAGLAAATWLAHVQAIIDDASLWVDLIVVEEIGIRLDGGDATINRLVQYNAARSSLVGAKVVLGTAHTLANQATHLGYLSGDNIHQNQTGSLYTAAEQAAELSLAVTPTPPAINGRLVVVPNGHAGTLTLSIATAAGSPSPTVLTFSDPVAPQVFTLGTGGSGGTSRSAGLGLDL